MTIIKQKGVTESGHAKNLRNYINDKAALARDFQNILNPARWSDEMARLRKVCGHDKASRRMRDKQTGEWKQAENTIMYHQILAFLPEEADINGGPMTPEACMRYAKEYAASRYPDYQIAFALHKEHCREDGTDRYAVHMAINRSNALTGKRLSEGRSGKAKRERAAFVREMDGRWSLKQVEEGVENSAIHKRQPQRVGAEKQIIDRAEKQGVAPEDASYKYNLRKLCQGLKKRARSMEEYRSLLAEWGVDTEIRGGKLFATDTDNNKYSFRVSRLDKALEENILTEVFARNAGNSKMARIEADVQKAMQDVADHKAAKTEYIAAVKRCYQDYQAKVRQQKGHTSEEIPQIQLPRIPEILAGDAEVRREVVKMIRKSDELRSRSVVKETGKQANVAKKEEMQQVRQRQERVHQSERTSRGNR